MTGLADVMIASAPVVVNTKGWDFGKYFYDFRAFHPRNAVIVNKTQWDGLPKAERQKISAVAAKAETRGWKLCHQVADSSLETLRKHGITVVEPDAKMMHAFRAKMSGIISEWAKRAGPDGETLRKDLGK
jgi:TRAP-type C4-dicarboxylate transport system substrate-binding protein